MNNQTTINNKQVLAIITDIRHCEVEVQFTALINNREAEVYGRYAVDTNVFYPETIGVFGLEQYATDILGLQDCIGLFETLQELFEKRDC